MSDTDHGLFDKFDVRDEDGEPVDDCFVLRPPDPAAVAALHTYIRATTNEALADDLREWLRDLGVKQDERTTPEETTREEAGE